MTDTWTTRDLPVLQAAVAIFDRTGLNLSVGELVEETGFDAETVQRSLRALYREPYFEEGMTDLNGDYQAIGAPTGDALRIAGQWPSAQVQLERLIAAFEAVAADDSRSEDERGRARKIGLWLTGTLSQVAIGALSGAGGNLMTG